MCSACATMRPRSSKRAAEQSRRSLMFAEKDERTRTAPISSATARSALPMIWSSISTVRSLFRDDPRARTSIPNPHPPGGDPGGGAVELEHERARGLARVARLAGRELQLRAGSHLGRPHRHELERPRAVGVAVALRVRAVEPLLQIGAERHRDL